MVDNIQTKCVAEDVPTMSQTQTPHFINYGNLDITNWVNDTSIRYVRKQLITTVNERIDGGIEAKNVGDNVVWNLIHIHEKEFRVREEAVPTMLKEAAAQWLKRFRKQVIEQMKQIVETKYLEAGNSEDFIDLQVEKFQFRSYSDLREQTRHENSDLVRIILLFLYCTV